MISDIWMSVMIRLNKVYDRLCTSRDVSTDNSIQINISMYKMSICRGNPTTNPFWRPSLPVE